MLCLLLQLTSSTFGQQSATNDTLNSQRYTDRANSDAYIKYQDSISLARSIFVKDSLKALGDSLSKVWIGTPDPNRANQFVDSLIDSYTVKGFHFEGWAIGFKKKTNRQNEGRLKPHGEGWVIVVTFSLLFFLGLIKFVFPKEFSLLFEAFYNNRVLGQLNKEDNILGSWPFIFMLLLFGFSVGLFLYLAGKYLLLKYIYDGFKWYLILSAIIVGLFIFKILMLLLIAFFFEIEKLIKEYISILYLSYFNTVLVLIPLVIALCLAPARFSVFYIYSTTIILGLIFLFQFLRAGINILTSYRFPKVYLILYLCALEICPLLILIKALSF
jgi:hypothetical protein